MGAYILRVICCALLVAVVKSFGGETKGKNLCCGVFLIFGILFPLKDLDIQIPALPGELYREGQALSREGELSAQRQIADGIIQRTQAYILEEARSLGAQVTVVSLALDEETLAPNRVELTGATGPYARRALEGYLQDSLGISREDQIWIP